MTILVLIIASVYVVGYLSSVDSQLTYMNNILRSYRERLDRMEKLLEENKE